MAQGLKAVTRRSVDKALAEFERLGRDKFLERHGFGPAKAYYVKHNGLLCDSKAIIGVARGYARPDLGPLSSDEFTGGEQSVRRKLIGLGFEVTGSSEQNPDWTRDEQIVALDFYFRHRPKIPGKASREIRELSRQLNSLAMMLGLKGGDTFRNVNGVYMKLMNFRRFDSTYTLHGGVGLTRGAAGEKLIWDEFSVNPVRLRKTSEMILSAMNAGETVTGLGDFAQGDDNCADASEGKIFTKLHRFRERNSKIVKAKKRQTINLLGRLACEVCDFDFREKYGERGEGFAECHHISAVSTYSSGQNTSLKDLAVLCANCHRMIHAKTPWITLEKLKELIKAATDRAFLRPQ